MSSAPSRVTEVLTPQASNHVTPATDSLSEDQLLAQVLAGAGERVRTAVERLTEMGIVDKDGKVLPQELPRDMRPDSETNADG